MKKLEEASEENEYTLFNLYAHIDSQSHNLVTLQVDGVPLEMEIDTGLSHIYVNLLATVAKQESGGLSDKFDDVLWCTTSSSGYSGCSDLSEPALDWQICHWQWWVVMA